MSNRIFDRISNFIRTNFISVLVVFMVFSSVANIILYHELSSLRDNPQQAVQDQTERFIKKISRLIVLPADEQPTIATVSDPELLKDHPFFAKAQKGFKVLIYANARKSVLYDPFENKVVEITSMNIGTQATPIPTPIQTSAANK